MNLKSEEKNFIVISGNNIDSLKDYPDNYFDSVVTDPPYGLGKEPNAEEMLRAWIDTGYLAVGGSGFMGKEWDAFVPQPLFWKEIFRVLKHGGHIVAFFGTRTYDWGCMAIRLAGFEIRDCIQWVYATGFPKSHNISKAIDKMYGKEREVVGEKECGYQVSISKKRVEEGHRPNLTNSTKKVDITIPATEEAKEWEGWGSAIKPANEPIVLARKPLEKGLSIAQNVLKWGTGAINIDGCRVSTDDIMSSGRHIQKNREYPSGYKDINRSEYEQNSQGRFPSNFILGHHFDCEMKIEKTIYTDTNEEESNEVWNCHDDCPIKILDEQSGELKSGKMTANHNRTTNGSPNGIYGKFDVNHPLAETYGDKGGASRFFYVAKASQWERNFGLQEFEQKQTTGGGGGGIGNYLEDINSASGKYGSEKAPSKNIHPTVKPIKLMQYLVRMITPPNGIVLDPFAGSGTTGIACKIDGFNFVGLELSEEYTEIANSRIESFKEEKVFIDETIIYKTRNKEEEEEDENHQLSLF